MTNFTFIYGDSYRKDLPSADKYRHQQNAYSIPIRKAKCQGTDSYYIDEELHDLYIPVVEGALNRIPKNRPIFLERNIGHCLKRRSPKLYAWLIERLTRVTSGS